jgi:membrane protein
VFGSSGPGRIGSKAVGYRRILHGAIVAGLPAGIPCCSSRYRFRGQRPFGGLPIIGAVSALALWLYLLHILVLCGFRVTVVLGRALDARV